MNNQLPPPLHTLIRDETLRGANILFTVGFSRSRSANYELATSLARQAEIYHQVEEGKTEAHMASFANTIEQIEVGLHLLSVIYNWNSSLFCVRGRVRSMWIASTMVLGCYKTALMTENQVAHCWVPIDDPSVEREYSALTELMPNKVIFPCRLLHPYFSFEHGGQVGLRDQIHARAVERDYDWCPYFNSDSGVNTIEKRL